MTCIDSLKFVCVCFIELKILKEVEVKGFRCLLLKIIKVLNLCYELLYIYILKENGIIKCRALSKNSGGENKFKIPLF